MRRLDRARAHRSRRASEPRRRHSRPRNSRRSASRARRLMREGTAGARSTMRHVAATEAFSRAPRIRISRAQLSPVSPRSRARNNGLLSVGHLDIAPAAASASSRGPGVGHQNQRAHPMAASGGISERDETAERDAADDRASRRPRRRAPRRHDGRTDHRSRPASNDARPRARRAATS